MLDQSTALFRRSSLGYAAAAVVLAGAVVAFVLGAKVAGFILLVVAVLCALGGFLVTLAGYSKSKTERAALVEKALARQRQAGGTPSESRER